MTDHVHDIAFPRRGAFALVAVLVAVAAAAALYGSSAIGALPLAAAVAAGLVGVALAIRSPLPLLLIYVAVIPFDASGILPIVGTLSRAAGAAFAIAYLLRWLRTLDVSVIPVSGWGFALWASLSYLWAIDRSLANEAIGTLLQLFVVAALVADYVRRDPSIVRPILIAYSLGSIATALLGIAAFAADRGALVAGRAEAFAGQDSAQFTAILLPAFLFLLWEVLDRRSLPALLGASIAAAAIVLSGTRSAWLAAAAVIAIQVIPRRSRVEQALLVGGLAAAVAVIGIVPQLRDLVTDRLTTALATGGAGRTDIWSVALHVFPGQPIIGTGYGTFPAAITPEAIRATTLPLRNVDVFTGPTGSHSIIAGTAVELGVVGLLLLAVFIGRAVLRPGWGAMGPVIQAIVMAFVLQSLFLDILNRKQVWLFLGVAFGLLALRRAGAALAPDPGPVPDSAATARRRRDRPATAGTDAPGMTEAPA